MSGLSHHPGKVAQGYPCREFESRSLRQPLVLLGSRMFTIAHKLNIHGAFAF